MKYDLKKEKIAVHCQTLEEAEKVVDKMLESGIELIPDVSKNETINWFNGNYAFFFSDFECKIDCWEGREAAINKSYQIIQASEYLSQFEEVPKYGDKVWVKDIMSGDWSKEPLIFAGFIDGICCVFWHEIQQNAFEDKQTFELVTFNFYRTTDPALDKPTLTLQEIADLKGVTLEQAKEMINQLNQ